MRILLFSDFGLPDSCANATRVINLAKLIKQLGHDIDVLGVSYKQTGDLIGHYNGISYEMLRATPYYGIHAMKRTRALERDLATFLNGREPYDAILLSNVYYDYARIFQEYAKKQNAKLIVNAVEWYDKGNELFKGVFGKINLIKNRIALKHIHSKMGNILAISSLLDHYYRERGCNTVTIPTIIDMDGYRSLTHPIALDNKIRIAYAGSPGKKDYVLNAVRALALLSTEEQKRIEFHFYGPEMTDLVRLGVSEDFLREGKVICHGRIPYGEVKHRIAEADFTILLRPNKRYANAGFPTKVGESMACGTPVIANLTSDIGKYLRDGKEGLVCTDETPEACADALRRALQLSPEELSEMRSAAHRCAQQHFDYRQYEKAMQAFLEACLVMK